MPAAAVELFGIDAVDKAEFDDIDRDLGVVDGRGGFPDAVEAERRITRDCSVVRGTMNPKSIESWRARRAISPSLVVTVAVEPSAWSRVTRSPAASVTW